MGFKNIFMSHLQRHWKNITQMKMSSECGKKELRRNLFVPQFHGREHLNVAVWMKALQEGHRNTILSFDEGMWGFAPG